MPIFDKLLEPVANAATKYAGTIMSKAGKCVYLKNNQNNFGKVDVNETKDELITEKVVEAIESKKD